MSMQYQAKFFYHAMDSEYNDLGERYDVPVHSFEVSGGAYRFIKLSSTDDISISSELEQARALKNLTLYLPPTKDGTDMEVALELTNVALLKAPFTLALSVERYSGGKMLEGLALIAESATLKTRPWVVPLKLLMVEIKLPSAKLYRGKIQGAKMTEYKEM